MTTNDLRALFPVSERYIYLNHAAVSPLATPTVEAMARHNADVHQNGARNWKQWEAGLAHARKTLAHFIGAEPGEIAFTKNTSAALSTIAQGFDWRPGDRMVSFDCEFPANVYPWLALADRGVRPEFLPAAALPDLDRVRAACRGARLLAVSFVQYLSGFRVDLDALGRICRETGTLLLVDAIQGLGAFPVDVRRAGIHFLAADGHKWMTGPEGAGILYIAPEVLDQVTPREVGWMSIAAWGDFNSGGEAARSGKLPPWHAGAARFECGTLSTAAILGLGAAVQLLADAGADATAAHLLQLGDRFRHQLLALGCELAAIPGAAGVPANRSGITSFRHPRVAAGKIVPSFETANILCAHRGGWVRCAPHLYNVQDEMDQVVDHVRKLIV